MEKKLINVDDPTIAENADCHMAASAGAGHSEEQSRRDKWAEVEEKGAQDYAEFYFFERTFKGFRYSL